MWRAGSVARQCLALASAGGGRQLSGAPGAGRDLVLLKGLVFHGYHGVLEEEKRLGQKFVVSAALSADLRAAGERDDLGATVDYAAVYSQIREIVEGPPQSLVESVAERIAGAILGAHPAVTAVTVSVEKPQVAVAGVVESLGVQITRAREATMPARTAA